MYENKTQQGLKKTPITNLKKQLYVSKPALHSDSYLDALLHTIDLQSTNSLREGMHSQVVEWRRPSLSLLRPQKLYVLVIQGIQCKCLDFSPTRNKGLSHCKNTLTPAVLCQQGNCRVLLYTKLHILFYCCHRGSTTGFD